MMKTKILHRFLLSVFILIFVNVLYSQTPTISGFSPSSGPVGTLVTITGTHFDNSTYITIGTVNAIVKSNTGTQLVGMVMPGTTTGQISITTSGGTANSAGNFTVTASSYSQQGSKLLPSDNIGASGFGNSVAVSNDGNTAIIGGPTDNNGVGAAWIFTHTGSSWAQKSKLSFSDVQGSASIGYSVSISADGNTAIVGGTADNNNNGAAWVFTRDNSGIWTQQGHKLIGIDQVSPSCFGRSVALSADGNTAIIGGESDNNAIGAVWIYTRINGIWVQQGNKLVGTGSIGQSIQGWSVAISADGNTAIEGGWGDNGIGAVWVFVRNNGLWTQQGNKLVGTSSYNNNSFQGISVAISADGNLAIVGSIGNGAWNYTRNNGNWSQTGFIAPDAVEPAFAELGINVSMNADGNRLILATVSGYGNGFVAFTNNNGITELGNLIVGTNQIGSTPYQSHFIALSGNATTAIVGSANDNSGNGAVWIFANASPLPTISNFTSTNGPVGTLVTISGTNLSNPSAITIGGVSAIPISNDGTTLVAMVMPGATTGNIRVITTGGTAASAGNFTVTATNYPSIQQGDKLVDSNTNTLNGSQGATVAISADGNTAVVGDFNYNNALGCARIYTRNGSVWMQEQILTFPLASRIWTLGWAVAISADGNTVVVDGWEMDSAYTDVFVFTRSNSTWSQQGELKVQGELHHGCPLAISADGNTILCASLGNVNNSSYSTCEVFSRNNNVWTHQTSLNNINAFWNIVLSADGNTAIMGAWGDPQGIYVFTRSGNLWTQQNNILPPPNAIGFGYSVAISADAGTIIVGAPITSSGSNPFYGAAYFYTRSGNSWIQQGTGIFADSSANYFGENTALSADGNIAMVEGLLLDSNHQATRQKGEWIYKRNNGVWALLENKISVNANADNSYKSLALSADGNTAIIGVPGDSKGGALIYVADSSLNGGNVNGGGGGGLESKDLGDAIVKRVYNKAFNNLNGPVDYNKLTIVGSGRTAGPTTFGLGGIASVTLAGIMPDITSSGYVAYNSTPLDITSITNASEVIATDFTINQEPKAVAFATKTLGALYDHTKPICDRLKGASLLNIAPIKVGGYDFVQYTLKDENGVTEYATSFSIGSKSGRNNFSVQSTWLLKDYVSEDVMYNFQLWAATPQLVNAMITDVLNRVEAVAPVTSISSINIPATYIVSGSRTGTNLNLLLTNGTANTSGYFTLQDQSTELSTSTASRQIPFMLNANGQSTVSIPMNDMYESTISMFVNGTMTDIVYMADGAWTVDYNQATTSVSSFTVNNDANRTYDTTEYPLLRNVELQGNSSDYVSLIKLLRGGGAATDISKYKTLKLTASGGYTLRATLVKNSITNWADQYYTEIKLDNNQKEYYVSLDNFISSASTNKINANDVTTIVFAIEVGSTTNSAINTTLSNISFTKLDANYLNNLNSKDIQLYPNPATARNFNCSFYSNTDAQQLILKVTDVMGRTIATQQVNAVKGLNVIHISLNANSNGIHIVSLDGNGVKYNSKKVVLTN